MRFSEAVADIFLTAKAKNHPVETATIDDESESEKCETCESDGVDACEAHSAQNDAITPVTIPVAAHVKQKKPGRMPHPIRQFIAFILGTALLIVAGLLFLKAFIPALILIAIALVVHPAGKDFLFRYFGFDLCSRCRAWVVILGSLLFLASLGWMNEKEPPNETAKPQSQSTGVVTR